MRIQPNYMFRFYSDFADSNFHINLLPRTFFLQCVNCFLGAWECCLGKSTATIGQFHSTRVADLTSTASLPSLLLLEHCYITENVWKSSFWQLSSAIDFNHFLPCILWLKQKSKTFFQFIILPSYFYLQAPNTLTSSPKQFNKDQERHTISNMRHTR